MNYFNLVGMYVTSKTGQEGIVKSVEKKGDKYFLHLIKKHGYAWFEISLLNGAYVIHPVQFFLDCLFGPMALGFACIFGSEKKYKIILGALFAVTLSVFSYFVSGVVFFAEFAPEGMNTYLYSFLYNFTSAGVEGILCIILLSIIPLGRFKKLVNVKDIASINIRKR